MIYLLLEAVAQTYSVKQAFLEISLNSWENTFATVSVLIKLRPQACNFIKIETLAQVFSCNLAKFLRTLFLTEHLRWLLLSYVTM